MASCVGAHRVARRVHGPRARCEHRVFRKEWRCVSSWGRRGSRQRCARARAPRPNQRCSKAAATKRRPRGGLLRCLAACGCQRRIAGRGREWLRISRLAQILAPGQTHQRQGNDSHLDPPDSGAAARHCRGACWLFIRVCSLHCPHSWQRMQALLHVALSGILKSHNAGVLKLSHSHSSKQPINQNSVPGLYLRIT